MQRNNDFYSLSKRQDRGAIHTLKTISMVTLSILFLAQPVASGVAVSDFTNFQNYKTSEKTPLSRGTLHLSQEDKWFRTELREAFKRKPDFAGRYVVASWGCGNECVIGAVIDVVTGRVYQIPFSICCWGTDVPVDFEPVEYRVDSKLFVIKGVLNETGDAKRYYYVFESNQFRYLGERPFSRH